MKRNFLKSALQDVSGNKAPGPYGYTAELYRTVSHKLLPISEVVYKHASETRETSPCSNFAGKKNEMYRLQTQFYFFNSNLKTIAVRFIKLLSNIVATIEWIYCMENFWKIIFTAQLIL